MNTLILAINIKLYTNKYAEIKNINENIYKL